MKPLLRARADSSKKAMAYSAAAMYGGAAFVGSIESLIPAGSKFSMMPSFIALTIVTALLLWGRRLPVWALATLGPIGAALIALAIATTHGHGDGAALYAWPVLWQSYFFGRRGTVMIVAWIGIVHGAALISLPPGVGYVDRWLDVMVTMIVVGGVVDLLAARNERLVKRLAGEARVDGLTGVLNRRGFIERARVELSRARRSGAPLGFVSFDIDHFKSVNDEFGHDAGDRVLARLGQLFHEQGRGGDLVGRMGGEEFVALLIDSDLARSLDYAERIRRAFAVEGPGLPRATLSAGVSVATSPIELQPHLQLADAALYAAKRAGRNRAMVDTRLQPELAVSA
ncbi:MAG: GGDEF domain-containing protein [Solirubrobacterales bacterium]